MAGTAASSPLCVPGRLGTGHTLGWLPGQLPPNYPLSPSCSWDTQAMRRRFSQAGPLQPGPVPSAAGIWVGAQPTDGQVVSETFCTVSCCCPMGRTGTQFRVRKLKGAEEGA